jgi:hypothetical protein
MCTVQEWCTTVPTPGRIFKDILPVSGKVNMMCQKLRTCVRKYGMYYGVVSGRMYYFTQKRMYYSVPVSGIINYLCQEGSLMVLGRVSLLCQDRVLQYLFQGGLYTTNFVRRQIHYLFKKVLSSTSGLMHHLCQD